MSGTAGLLGYLAIGDNRRSFVVRGLLANQGPARVLDGNFVLMDIELSGMDGIAATRALRGVYAHDVHARQEVLSMIQER